MDNSAALRAGSQRAKDIIANHVLNTILIPAAKDLVQDAVRGRIFVGHNMTGNTINSYAAGVYVQGQLAFIETSTGSISKPLRKKLGKGQRFYAGSQRWDGETQGVTFTAKVGTNGSTEAERSIAFLQSHKPSPKGWALVICNGVEYASFQENEMNIDTLTRNYNDSKMIVEFKFTPIPD